MFLSLDESCSIMKQSKMHISRSIVFVSDKYNTTARLSIHGLILLV